MLGVGCDSEPSLRGWMDGHDAGGAATVRWLLEGDVGVVVVVVRFQSTADCYTRDDEDCHCIRSSDIAKLVFCDIS